jgi:predicted kinase
MGRDRPTLWVVCGIPGVGKTSVATYLAEQCDAGLFRTDVIRKELVDEPAYTDAEYDRVYETILDRGLASLRDGQSVVFDGTYRNRERRESVAELADQENVACRFLRVECDSAVVETRIANRDDVSDAQFEEHLMIKAEFEEIERDHVTVDNSGSKTDARAEVDELLAADGIACGPDTA